MLAVMINSSAARLQGFPARSRIHYSNKQEEIALGGLVAVEVGVDEWILVMPSYYHHNQHSHRWKLWWGLVVVILSVEHSHHHPLYYKSTC